MWNDPRRCIMESFSLENLVLGSHKTTRRNVMAAMTDAANASFSDDALVIRFVSMPNNNNLTVWYMHRINSIANYLPLKCLDGSCVVGVVESWNMLVEPTTAFNNWCRTWRVCSRLRDTCGGVLCSAYDWCISWIIILSVRSWNDVNGCSCCLYHG